MNTQNELWRETARVGGLWRDEVARLLRGRRTASTEPGGNAGAVDERNTTPMKRHLYRSPNDRMLRGVCAGLAEYFGVSATLVRIAFVALALPGVIHMVIIYALLAYVMPEAPGTIGARD